MSYYLSETIPNVKNAGNKARKDCISIFNQSGFEKVEFVDKNNKIKNMISIIKIMRQIPKNEKLYVQYPFISKINWLLPYMCKKCKIVILIHDIDELRYLSNPKKIKNKISVLNEAEGIISQTPEMTDFLILNGIPKVKLFTLNLFDYLINWSNHDHYKDKSLLCFSGDLGKSKFIYKIPADINKYGFNLYGIGLDKHKLSKDIVYKGSFSPDQIPFELEGKYGLVWDGEEINNCSGLIGNYLRYNAPHKVSMYLVANMPIIIWDKAAEAKLIQKYKIGLTVSSIENTPNIVKNVSDKEYNEMQHNIEKIAKKLSTGYFLKTQIRLIEKKL